LTIEAFQTLDGDAAAPAAGSLGNSISSQAIDAYFATEGCLTDATAPITSATSSSDLGRTALAGTATSLGLVSLWAALLPGSCSPVNTEVPPAFYADNSVPSIFGHCKHQNQDE
jgi:hypothetical protein